MNLALRYAINDAKEKLVSFRCILSLLKNRHYTSLLFLKNLVGRNNYRLLFYIMTMLIFQKNKNYFN